MLGRIADGRLSRLGRKLNHPTQLTLIDLIALTSIAAFGVAIAPAIVWCFRESEWCGLFFTSATTAFVGYLAICHGHFLLARSIAALFCGQVFYFVASLPISILGMCFYDDLSIHTAACYSLTTATITFVWLAFWRSEELSEFHQAAMCSYLSPIIFLIAAALTGSYRDPSHNKLPELTFGTVSYTHLTLPTICSV